MALSTATAEMEFCPDAPSEDPGGIRRLSARSPHSVSPFLHVLHDAIDLDPSGMMGRWHNALPWDAGVDLFFVISGFVDGLCLNGPVRPARQRRALRSAAPHTDRAAFYWAATTLFLLITLTARSVVTEGAGNLTPTS